MRGFTLIELLLVMAIASLLVMLSSTAVVWYARKAAEFEVIRSVDAAVRQIPGLAARSGCWVQLKVDVDGHSLAISACGQLSKRVDLPDHYLLVPFSPEWQLPPDVEQGKGFGAAKLRGFSAWFSPDGLGALGGIKLQRSQSTVATFPLGRTPIPRS